MFVANSLRPPLAAVSPADHTRMVEDVVLRTLQGTHEVPHAPTPIAGASGALPPTHSSSVHPADVSVIEGVVHRVLQGFLGGQQGDEPPPTYVR